MRHLMFIRKIACLKDPIFLNFLTNLNISLE